MHHHSRFLRAGLLSLLIPIVAALGLTSASAQVQPRRAGLVVHFPDGSNQMKCVQFAEDELTGEELLLRSGWNVLIDASYGLGGAVCSIDGRGCPVDDCFCECRGGTQCEYWAYWHLQGNEWEYSQTGGGAYNITDGAVDGWSWGPGNFQTGTEPPTYTFEQICGRSSSSSPTPSENTPGPESRAPDGTLTADDTLLTSQKCTVLRWTVFDADRVTLNGEHVMAQDRLEYCPASTQRFTLVASNAVGTITREVIVRVEGRTSATPTPTLPPTQSIVQGTPTQPPPLQLPATIPPPEPGTLPEPVSAPAPIATTAVPEATRGLEAAVPRPTDVMTAATASVAPADLPALAVALTALPTPVLVAEAPHPRAEGSRATPTPILMALAPDVEEAAPAAARPPVAQFDAGLLPGYAAFLLIAAALAGVAAWVWQRRRVS